jgi:hypothetical protein
MLAGDALYFILIQSSQGLKMLLKIILKATKFGSSKFVKRNQKCIQPVL